MMQIQLPAYYSLLLVTAIVLAFLLATAALAVLSFADTPRGQRLLRNYYGKRLAGTRLWSMLEHRQVPPLRFIEKTSLASVRAALRACRRCPKQEMCDETLGYVGWRHRNYSFCPNRQTIERLIPR